MHPLDSLNATMLNGQNSILGLLDLWIQLYLATVSLR